MVEGLRFAQKTQRLSAIAACARGAHGTQKSSRAHHPDHITAVHGKWIFRIGNEKIAPQGSCPGSSNAIGTAQRANRSPRYLHPVRLRCPVLRRTLLFDAPPESDTFAARQRDFRASVTCLERRSSEALE
jgi:hypothetical protein